MRKEDFVAGKSLTIKQDQADRDIYHFYCSTPSKESLYFASTHIDCLFEIFPNAVLDELENGRDLQVELRVVKNG